MNPVLLIVIPLVAAFISVMIKEKAKFILVIAAITNVGILITLQLGDYTIGGFKAPYGINLTLDGYSIIGVISLNILFLLLVVVNFQRLEKFSIVVLISMAGLNGMILTGDLFNLFVFIEISSIAAYIITTQNKNYVQSFQYLVIGGIGSSLYLLGLILLYSMTGTLNLYDIASRIVSMNLTGAELLIPFLLMFIGLGVESKLFPLNSWVKGILENANSLVGALISSLYALTIMFVFGRIIVDLFSFSEGLFKIIIVTGVITLIVGEVSAFSSNKLREMLLFSTIGQAGLIIILFAYDFTSLGILLIIGNAISKFVLFTIAGRIAEENENDEIENIKGIFAKHKILGLCFSIASLSMIGIPLFFGFIVKLNMLVALFNDGRSLLAAVILIVSIVEGAYFMRALVKMWNSGNEGEKPSLGAAIDMKLKAQATTLLIISSLSVILIVFGIFPDLYANLANHGSSALMNSHPIELLGKIGGIK